MIKSKFNIKIMPDDTILTKNVNGYTNDLFGVHKNTVGLWTVTQLKSGKSIIMLKLLKDAKRLADILNGLGDGATRDELFEATRKFINKGGL